MDQEREKAKPEARDPSPEVVARDDVRVDASPVRCPYCHDDVSPDASDWVACRACLARHHAACWTEGGVCASCGGTASLVSNRRAPSVGKYWVAIALVLILFLVVRLNTGGERDAVEEARVQIRWTAEKERSRIEAERARLEAERERLDAELARARARAARAANGDHTSAGPDKDRKLAKHLRELFSRRRGVSLEVTGPGETVLRTVEVPYNELLFGFDEDSLSDMILSFGSEAHTRIFPGGSRGSRLTLILDGVRIRGSQFAEPGLPGGGTGLNLVLAASEFDEATVRRLEAAVAALPPAGGK